MKKLFLFVLSLSIVFVSCKKDEKDDDNNNNTTSCDSTVTPVVFMHGLLASGDTYANQVMRFSSNNYCENRLFAFDWNTLAQGADNASTLDVFIDEVLQKTGATKVNLVGHSAGGGLGYNYLSDAARAAKVAHYVHVGSGTQPGPAGPNGEVPTLNIWSPDDEVVQSADIPNATNVSVAGKDHYEIATCAEAFDAMYNFFNDKAPTTTAILSSTEVKISGRAVTLGENQVKPQTTVQIFEINATTGERLNSSPDVTVTVDAKGYWGPVSVKPNKPYELFVNSNEAGDRVVHYYREGFVRNNPLVYLRLLPPPSSFAGNLLNSLPKDDDQSVVVVFTANQAVLNGRDVLEVNNNLLSTPDFCSAASSTIAMFLYDDGDAQTELTSANQLFSGFPFLEAVDVFFPTATPQTINCEFNGRSLPARNWKSDTEGVTIVVFD
jgi:triacylglycerol lipase